MFTYQDKNATPISEPACILLPVIPESMLDELDDSQQQYYSIHPSLKKPSGASYKNTFLKAYSIITKISAKIGQEKLLRVKTLWQFEPSQYG